MAANDVVDWTNSALEWTAFTSSDVATGAASTNPVVPDERAASEADALTLRAFDAGMCEGAADVGSDVLALALSALGAE